MKGRGVQKGRLCVEHCCNIDVDVDDDDDDDGDVDVIVGYASLWTPLP